MCSTHSVGGMDQVVTRPIAFCLSVLLSSFAFPARGKPRSSEDAATVSQICRTAAPGARQDRPGKRQITGEQDVYPEGFLQLSQLGFSLRDRDLDRCR